MRPGKPDRRPGKSARNERRKALATTLNALSVAALVAALVQPSLVGHVSLWSGGAALALFVALQAALHYLLSRVED